MKVEKFSGHGNIEFDLTEDVQIELVFDGIWHLYVDGVIVAPRLSISRSLKMILREGESIIIKCAKDVNYNGTLTYLENKQVVGESMLQEGEDGISLEDRMRAQMMAQVSQWAKEHGMDSLEDDDDDFFEDDDDPLSVYEQREMVEEYLIDQGTNPKKVLDELNAPPKATSQAPKETEGETSEAR